MKTGIKKLLAMALVAAMSLSLAACGGGGDDTDKPKPIPKPTPEIEVLDTGVLKQAISEDEAMAVAFLGYCEDSLDEIEDYLTAINMDMGDYSFVMEIAEEYRIDAEGEELYCVVPKNDDDTVTISEWVIDEYNDWQGEEGNVLYHEENNGNPVLIKCNVSEIVPDVLITITDAEGNVSRMVPYISRMDSTLQNSLADEKPFYDFSPYSLFMPGWGDGEGYYGDDGFDIVYLTGDWTTEVYTIDDTYLDGSFTFDGSGNVYFAWGEAGEYFAVYYEGSYYMAEDPSLPEDAVILDMYLTEDNTYSGRPDTLYTAVTFEMSTYGDFMGMSYETGDLLFGNEYDTYYELSYAAG